MDKYVDRQLNIFTDGQINIQLDRIINRQKYRYRYNKCRQIDEFVDR